MPFVIFGVVLGLIFGTRAIVGAATHKPAAQAKAGPAQKTGYATGASGDPPAEIVNRFAADLAVADGKLTSGEPSRVYAFGTTDPLSDASYALLTALRRALALAEDPSAWTLNFQYSWNEYTGPNAQKLVTDGIYGPQTKARLIRVIHAWMQQDPSGSWAYPAPLSLSPSPHGAA